MSQLYSNSIFWVDIEKVKPNPFQPRREFDEDRLRDLADSIRQYGVLQPLVVSREEIQKEGDGGISVEYELIAGERRLRAAKLAGVPQVPAGGLRPARSPAPGGRGRAGGACRASRGSSPAAGSPTCRGRGGEQVRCRRESRSSCRQAGTRRPDR